MRHLQISSPILSVSFGFVDCFFCCAEAFYFDILPIVNFDHSDRCEVIFHCGFDLHLLGNE